jgi:hypothetical protein
MKSPFRGSFSLTTIPAHVRASSAKLISSSFIFLQSRNQLYAQNPVASHLGVFQGTSGCKEFFANEALVDVLSDHDEHFANLVDAAKSPHLNFLFSSQI